MNRDAILAHLHNRLPDLQAVTVRFIKTHLDAFLDFTRAIPLGDANAK